jgi:hypothetical protein
MQTSGAGAGNRILVCSLGSEGSVLKLQAHVPLFKPHNDAQLAGLIIICE